MDVEGAEPLVLQGATRLLIKDRPVILAELHPTQLERASGMTAAGFLEQIHQLGYRVQDLSGAPIDRAPEAAMVSVVLVPLG